MGQTGELEREWVREGLYYRDCKTDNAETAGVADCGCKFGKTDPLHATLDNGNWKLSDALILNTRLYTDRVPLIPKARVSAVLKGMVRVYGNAQVKQTRLSIYEA